MKVAALEAWFGQDTEYAATRQRLLGIAKGTNDWMTADRTVKACSLRTSTDKAQREAVLALARTGMKLEKNDWTLLALGMAEYRTETYLAPTKPLLPPPTPH